MTAHLDDVRVAGQHGLDFRRIDVLAAGHDHVLDAIFDEDEAIRIDVAGIAAVEPAAAHGLGWWPPGRAQ